MTVMITKEDRFLGLPLILVRDVLRTWKRGSRSVTDIASKKSISLDPRMVLAILQDCKELGHIGQEEPDDRIPGLTPSGRAIAAGDARKRTPKHKAQALLDALLGRAEAINADHRCPIGVERVWIFGSMVDGSKPDVGDIDVVVETGRRLLESETGSLNGYRRFLGRLERYYGEAVPSNHWSMEEYVTNRLLYGKRRHPIFSPNDLSRLQDLHRPCQLVFDYSRGGRVNDPVLPHHPESTGRADYINDRLVLPDLDKVADNPGPTSSYWISLGLGFSPPWSLRHMAEGEAYPSFDKVVVEVLDGPEDARFFFSGKPPRGLGLDAESPDFAIAFKRIGEASPEPWVLMVRRVLDIKGSTWTSRTTVTAVGERGMTLGPRTIIEVRAILSALSGADLVRLAHRRAALGLDEVVLVQEIDVAVKGSVGERLERAMEAIIETDLDLSYLPEDRRHSVFRRIGSLDETFACAPAPWSARP